MEQIETKRLILRPVEPERDGAFVLQMLNEPDYIANVHLQYGGWGSGIYVNGATGVSSVGRGQLYGGKCRVRASALREAGNDKWELPTWPVTLRGSSRVSRERLRYNHVYRRMRSVL